MYKSTDLTIGNQSYHLIFCNCSEDHLHLVYLYVSNGKTPLIKDNSNI